MQIIPAIDIRNGRCVRLMQGEFDREEVYSDNPVETALYWQEQGAERLHIVDLDGARSGKTENRDLIQEICNKLVIPIQVGGGIRSMDKIKLFLDAGVDRVILGTAALRNPEILEEAIQEFAAERIVAGIDARQGKVAVEGWQQTSNMRVKDVIDELKAIGVKIFIYTDISKDGMLRGPDFAGVRKLNKIEGIQVIASGGISSREDLRKLNDDGVPACIVGKALYTGDLDIKEILEEFRC